MFSDYAKSGTSQLWDQFLPFHGLFFVSIISCGPGLEKVVRLFFFFFSRSVKQLPLEAVV